MGLDISAYEHLEIIVAKPVDGWTDEDYARHDEPGVTSLYVVNGFRKTADGLVDGFYRHSGETHGFRAGSYGGYNKWRRQLAALVGTTPDDVWANPKPGPFVELINNADNEGTIGPVTSAKLAKDFADWHERADAYDAGPGDEGWFISRYREWRKAFEIAAKGGAVCLH